MKKLIILLLVVIGFTTQAQNYVGYSKQEVISGLLSNGESYQEDTTDTNVVYIGTENRITGTIKIYYFNTFNECLRYVIFYRNLSYDDLYKNLSKLYKRFNNKWYDTGTEISIEYDKGLNGYFVKFDKYEL